MNSKILAAAAACLVAATAFCASAPEPFKSGERVAFLGDSITYADKYIEYLRLFVALRHPGVAPAFLNCGIPGDNCQLAGKRLERDVFVHSPERVFVMLGINDLEGWRYSSGKPADVEARQKALDLFPVDYRRLIESLKTRCPKAVLMTPTPYDQYSDAKAAVWTDFNEVALAKAALSVRNCADEEGLPSIDLFTPMTDLLKAHPELKLCGDDRTHPDFAGNFLIAALIFSACGEGAEVASVSIDFATRECSSSNAKVSEPRFASGFVSFVYSPAALPLPAGAEYRQLEAVYPLSSKLNRETLAVKSLPPGRYVLRVAKDALGEFSAAELAAGINIATLGTPSQRRAKAAEGVARNLMGKGLILREAAWMEELVSRQGGDPKDEDSAFSTLDRYLDSLKGKGSFKSYRRMIGDYKTNRADLPDLRKAFAARVAELMKVATPEPFKIEIERRKD